MTESSKAPSEGGVPAKDHVNPAGKDVEISMLLSFLGVKDSDEASTKSPEHGGALPPPEPLATTSSGTPGEGSLAPRIQAEPCTSHCNADSDSVNYYGHFDGYLPYDQPASNDLNLFAHTAELFLGLPPPSATSNYYPHPEGEGPQAALYGSSGQWNGECHQQAASVQGGRKDVMHWFQGVDRTQLPAEGQSWGDQAWHADEAPQPRAIRPQHWDHDGLHVDEVGGYYDRMGFYHNPRGNHMEKYDYHMEKMTNTSGDIVRRLANWYSQGSEGHSNHTWPTHGGNRGIVVRESNYSYGTKGSPEDWSWHRTFDPPPSRTHDDRGRQAALGSTGLPESSAKPGDESAGERGDVNPMEFEVPAHSKFFIIKSFNMADVRQALKHSMWASTEHGNHRLQTAYETGAEVFLFFSVNGSGFFCGMARMTSPVDKSRKSDIWSDDRWGGSFRIQWIFLKDVPNKRVHHLRVGSKSVTRSRDAQEMLPDQGKQMVEAFVEHRGRGTLMEPEAEASPPSLESPAAPTAKGGEED